MLRALVISLLLLVTFSSMLPIGESLVEAARRTAAAGRAGRRQYRRHSRAWWRRHRARLRRQHALAAARRRRRWALRRRGQQSATLNRRRAAGTLAYLPLAQPLRLPSISPSSIESMPLIRAEVEGASPTLNAAALPSLPVSGPLKLSAALSPVAPAANVSAPLPAPALVATALPAPLPAPLMRLAATPSPSPLAHAALTPAPSAPPAAATVAAAPPARTQQRPAGLPVPRNWANVSSTVGGEFKFSLRAADGRPAGTAAWSRAGVSGAANSERRNRALAGVSHASLRRTVIDRMLQEGGWVVNDVEREVAGQKVYVVFAQSAGEGGARRAWTYYFVEFGGQIYSLSTAVPSAYADTAAAEAEQTLAAFGSRLNPAPSARR
jgi:hypothetical protein